MKLVLKIVGGLLGLVVILAVGFYAKVSMTWNPDYSSVEKPALKASTDPEVIKRGEYLAHAVSHCSICHAPEQVTADRKPGEKPVMSGGYRWVMGPLGTLTSPNITPDPETGIGAWTDEELARVLRHGVGRDGKLRGFMTLSVPAMADEDLVAVISYLRSTQPVKVQQPPHELGFIWKWIATKLTPDFRRLLDRDLKYVPEGPEPSVERGGYLARGPAFCIGCHTQLDIMSMTLAGEPFSGSDEAEPDGKDPTMEFRSPNLTPDPDTGHITKWEEDAFVARFKQGRAIKGSKMPWEAYRDMHESDMRSIFRFLKTLPPARHVIGETHRKKT